jgi:putative FmdB family regulatory protein
MPVPIFDYQCEACGHIFDVLQKLGAQPPSGCPECRAPQLKKLLSAPNVHISRGAERTGAGMSQGARPKFAHTFDSAVPHSHDHEHSHSGTHKHKHQAG